MHKDKLNKMYLEEEKKIHEFEKSINDLIKTGSYPKKLTLPLSVQLELTANCNLRCKHCYNRSGERETYKENLKPNQWFNIANDIVSSGGVFQVILSGGEPLLLSDNLFELMDIFHQDGSRFILITNGYLLDAEIIDRLKKYNFAWLQISIDGVDQKTHDDFRRKEGSWQRAIEAAIQVSNAGIPLKIASCLQPSEINKIDNYVKQAYQLGASSIIIGDIMPSGRTFDNSNLTLNNKQKLELFNNICEAKKLFQGRIDIQTSSFMKLQLMQASIGVIDSVIIRPNGDIRLDCIAPFVVGNIKDNDLSEIWKNIPGDIWKNKKIQYYIETVDKFSGNSDFISNYQDSDIFLKE